MIIGSYFFYWLIYCILYFFILIFSKLHAHFQSMEVRNSSFAAFIDIFTANTYVMVIMSDSSICKYMCSLHVPRLLINFKNRKWLTVPTFASSCALFMHYFDIVSFTWSAYFMSHDYFSPINSLCFDLFCFSLMNVLPTLENRNVRLYYPYRQYTNFFLFLFVCVL